MRLAVRLMRDKRRIIPSRTVADHSKRSARSGTEEWRIEELRRYVRAAKSERRRDRSRIPAADTAGAGRRAAVGQGVVEFKPLITCCDLRIRLYGYTRQAIRGLGAIPRRMAHAATTGSAFKAQPSFVESGILGEQVSFQRRLS